MDRLKSVLADKIIEVASENSDSSKSQLEKLNRFRDFSYACEVLMKKYPRIEEELILMIESNDFDTRVASSRVNNVISFVEDGNDLHSENLSSEYASESKDHALPVTPETFAAIDQAAAENEDIWQAEENEIEEQRVHNELSDPKVEEMSVSDKTDDAEENAEAVSNISDTETVNPYASSEDVSFDYSQENNTKTNTQRILTVLAVVAGVILLYFLAIFVMHNWKSILIVLAIIVAVGGLVWLLATKKNNIE